MNLAVLMSQPLANDSQFFSNSHSQIFTVKKEVIPPSNS